MVEGRSDCIRNEIAPLRATASGFHARGSDSRTAATHRPTPLQLHSPSCEVLPWGRFPLIRTNPRSMMSSATNPAATSIDLSWLVNVLLAAADPIEAPPQEPHGANQLAHQTAFGQSSAEPRSHDSAQKDVELLIYDRALNGDPEAQFDLGVTYDRGDGVPRDATQALKWYQEATDHGLPKSQYTLGAKYGLGRDLPMNKIESFRWIHYAANQGHSPSQWLTASLYFGSFGVHRDNVEAYKWA